MSRPKVWLSLFAVVLMLSLTLVAVSAAPAADQCGSSVTHTVQAGENLFRISLRYNTSMAAIASASGIGNYDLIFVGQTLTIPCGSSGGSSSSAPVYYAPDPTATPFDANGDLPAFDVKKGVNLPDTVTVDCGKLKPTAPLDGLAYSYNTFYWNPVPGATGYRINVYNLDMAPGKLVATFDTPATLTHLDGNLSNVGPGFLFRWEVQALVSDIVVCQSKQVTTWRSATP